MARSRRAHAAEGTAGSCGRCCWWCRRWSCCRRSRSTHSGRIWASIEADARRNASVAAAELSRRIGERLAAGIVAAGDEQIRATLIDWSAARAEAPGTGGARRPQRRGDGRLRASAVTGLIVGGRVRLPVDYPKVPTPPPWLDTLTASQSRWWRAAADAAPGSGPHGDSAGFREAGRRTGRRSSQRRVAARAGRDQTRGRVAGGGATCRPLRALPGAPHRIRHARRRRRPPACTAKRGRNPLPEPVDAQAELRVEHPSS